jgi:hypothetical protein
MESFAMANRQSPPYPFWLRAALPLFFVVAAALSGCGGAQETGTQVQPTEEPKKATNSMADFMKKSAPKKAPAK